MTEKVDFSALLGSRDPSSLLISFFLSRLVLVRRPAEEAIKSSRMASRDDANFFHGRGKQDK
jgi:hypothetical protein